MKKFIIILFFVILLLVSTGKSYADHEQTSSAHMIAMVQANNLDSRVKVLREYLNLYNSPLADHADTFILSADKYNLDWRLLPAISGVESTFGQSIPSNSYNGWGWGIYGTNVVRFLSWDDAITTISQALRERYLRTIDSSDPYIIGPTYAASPTWAARVTYFMNSIHSFEVATAKDSLSISL